MAEDDDVGILREHARRVAVAKSSIASVYGDVSVDNKQLRRSLELLRKDIDDALAALDKIEALARGL